MQVNKHSGDQRKKFFYFYTEHKCDRDLELLCMHHMVKLKWIVHQYHISVTYCYWLSTFGRQTFSVAGPTLRNSYRILFMIQHWVLTALGNHIHFFGIIIELLNILSTVEILQDSVVYKFTIEIDNERRAHTNLVRIFQASYPDHQQQCLKTH